MFKKLLWCLLTLVIVIIIVMWWVIRHNIITIIFFLGVCSKYKITITIILRIFNLFLSNIWSSSCGCASRISQLPEWETSLDQCPRAFYKLAYNFSSSSLFGLFKILSIFQVKNSSTVTCLGSSMFYMGFNKHMLERHYTNTPVDQC